ncbi:unnamed protein product [Lactuca saligna]|uniref:Uncharacterized protein n=1 Tax=Lactuca saligna TaxID=75948 RepID=A0AA35ZXG2_LACSI|nr:unnamed protein product [Lactuca saligna]
MLNRMVGISGSGTLPKQGEKLRSQMMKNLRKQLVNLKLKLRNERLVKHMSKALFPLWSIERILNEAVNNLNVYWLEPDALFKLENSLESHLDFSTTLKAFMFRCYEKIEKDPNSDNDVNHSLFSFYLKYGKPQYQTWSSKKIVVVKVFGPVKTESFINVIFKVVQGAGSSVFEFSLANLPCLNPYDRISLFNRLSKDE